jgi:hypothetical protein
VSETAAPKLQLGRVGESVPRIDGIEGTGEFAYSVTCRRRGCSGSHGAQPTCARPHRDDRHLEGSVPPGVRGAHTRGCSRREAVRPRVPGQTGARLRTRALLASRSRSSRPSIRQARRAAERILVEYELLELVVDPERDGAGPTSSRPADDGPATRRSTSEHRPLANHQARRPHAEGDVTVSGVYEVRIQDQAFLGPESARGA